MTENECIAIVAAIFHAADRVCSEIYRASKDGSHHEYPLNSYDECVDSARFMLDRAKRADPVTT